MESKALKRLQIKRKLLKEGPHILKQKKEDPVQTNKTGSFKITVIKHERKSKSMYNENG